MTVKINTFVILTFKHSKDQEKTFMKMFQQDIDLLFCVPKNRPENFPASIFLLISGCHWMNYTMKYVV